MGSLELMIGFLFAIWIVGSILSFTVPASSKAKTQALIIVTSLIYILPSFIGLLLSINIAWLSNHTAIATIGWNWFTIGHTAIPLTFEFNTLTMPLLVVVSAISFLVHVYANGYMKQDLARPRFFTTLGLFTLSMLGLTLSGNLLQLFMFWELVGLCSYLLIGFYRSKPEAAESATKTLIINKIGDVGFLVALMALWAVTDTLNLDSLASVPLSVEWRTFIGTAILIAVLAKSAQFPFHTWLPDAMVGPTPVSALIHSATMVAAGVFLLARLQFLFSPFTLQLAALLGGITAFIGGINAIRENDLKRFLAWSTLSQLGLMVMVAGSEAFNASYVHLLSHAIFKAGLFLSIGILIQHYHIKSFNERVSVSTMLKVFMIVLITALIGMPFTIGFLSKEILIGTVQSPIVTITISLLSFVTAFYSARLLMFITSNNDEKTSPVPWLMFAPIAILSLASLWIFHSWSPLQAPGVNQTFQLTSPSISIAIMNTGIILFGMAIGMALIRQGKLAHIQKLIPSIPYDAWLRIFFVKPVLALSVAANGTDAKIDRGIHLIVYVKVAFAHFIAKVDYYVVDGFVQALAWLTKAAGNAFRKLVTGQIQDYIWWTVVALIFILWLVQ